MKRTITMLAIMIVLSLAFGQFAAPASSAGRENHSPAVEIVEIHQGDTVDGVVKVWVKAGDEDGVEEIQNVQVKIDQGHWLNATFDEVDEHHSYWFYEWDTTTVGNGEHHIHARAFDRNGSGEMHGIGVNVQNGGENHIPRLEIVAPAMDTNVSGIVEILVAAMDPDGNDKLEWVKLKLEEGEWHNAEFKEVAEGHSWWVHTWNTTEYENGWYHLSAKAFDGVDDSEVDVVEINVQNALPNHAPSAEIVEMHQGDTLSGIVDVWIRASDPDGMEDIDSVLVKIDEGDWRNAVFNHNGDVASFWIYEWDTTTIENGEHHIRALALDEGDDGEQDVIWVIVHNEPENHLPRAEFVEPVQGDRLNGIVEVVVGATDPDGNDDIEMVFVKIDEGEWHNATFNEEGEGHSFWVFEWDTTAVENGEHHIRAVAFDGVDDGEPDVIGVIVHNEPENQRPRVEITAPLQGDRINGVVEIEVAAMDPDGNDGLEMVYVRIDRGEWHNATFHDDAEGHSLWSFLWDTTTVDNGEHHIHAMAFDGEDESELHTIGVAVHNEIHVNQPPTAEIVDVWPIDNGVVKGIVTILVEAADPDGLDDIENVQVRINEHEWHMTRFEAVRGGVSLWSFRWDTTAVRDGEHTIWARAFDGEDHSMVDMKGILVLQDNGEPHQRDERHSRVDESWEDIYDDHIEAGIGEGSIGAEMTISKEGREAAANTITYLTGMVLEMEKVSAQRVDITVSGDFSEGKIMVLNIDDTVMDISNVDDLVFRFDGEVMELSNINLMLTEKGDKALYCLTVGNDGLRVLIYIPHFSEHVITIESKSFISTPMEVKSQEFMGTFAIVAIIAGIVVVLVLFTNVLRLGKKEHRLIPKDERIPGLSPMFNLMDREFDDEEDPEE